jgi:hypothetical protein
VVERLVPGGQGPAFGTGQAVGFGVARGSGWVPLLRGSPPVSVLGDAEHLARRRGRLCRLEVAEAEVVEDLADRHLVGTKAMRLMRWPPRAQTSGSTW